MKKVVIGERKDNVDYDFRETCFGIIEKDGVFYLTAKNGELSLVGGGVEEGESHIDTLKREAMEEAGLFVEEVHDFITIDCFWYTRDNRNMESLANFYIVSISDKIVESTEKESVLVKLSKEELIDKLVLPYQKEAIKIYLEIDK